MKKVELVLPAGNEECLRAAVANGADAVYLGLDRFNARLFAGNFNESNIASVIDYCHKCNVKVYLTFNILIKNDEIRDYLEKINIAYSAGADAIIIQDPCLISIIKSNFPKLRIHLSTQAAALNTYSVPEEIARVVLPRELSLEEIKNFSNKFETEIFVHGALCISYSGLCLFSSIAGGRSGNRGQCAQPCRQMYNNKYALSTMDLCMLEKIPELIGLGVTAFKIEGRMRSPLYVATAARVYRKYIDMFYSGKNFVIDKKDIADLKLAFNREFTTGFAYNDSIVNPAKPMNRGLYLGTVTDGKIKLREILKVGDGIGIWRNDKVTGQTVKEIIKNNKTVKEAEKDELIAIPDLANGDIIYKTSSVDAKINLGEQIKITTQQTVKKEIKMPEIAEKDNKDKIKIFVKVYNKKSAVAADKAKADVIYYDVLADDCLEVKKSIKNSKFFVSTPRILSDDKIKEVVEKINKINPDGVLVGNRGLLKFLDKYEKHLDYSFNTFNDFDISFCKDALPIMSPELNFNEMISLKNKNFIAFIHEDIILMTTKQQIKSPELVDKEQRHFKVRHNHGVTEILNYKQLGLFNKALNYKSHGIKYFYIDLMNDADKFIKIYRKILNDEKFDDSKITKGYTTGHFSRGV